MTEQPNYQPIRTDDGEFSILWDDDPTAEFASIFPRGRPAAVIAVHGLPPLPLTA